MVPCFLRNTHTASRVGARVTFMSRYWMGARRRGPQPPPRPRDLTRSRSSFRSSSLERILSMAAQPLRFHRFPCADTPSSEARQQTSPSHSCHSMITDVLQRLCKVRGGRGPKHGLPEGQRSRCAPLQAVLPGPRRPSLLCPMFLCTASIAS